MKQAVTMLLCLILCLCAPAFAESGDNGDAVDTAYDPGIQFSIRRGFDGCHTAQDLAEELGVALSEGVPLYDPPNPMPFYAYMITDVECEVGIPQKGMFKVQDQGLVESITDYLDQWKAAINAESGAVVRFAGTSIADILIIARQTFEPYDRYGVTGGTTAYSSRVTLRAVQLTNPQNTCEVTFVHNPVDTISVPPGTEICWVDPPEIANTEELRDFVSGILSWYGYGASLGDEGENVRAVQQALIARRFMDGRADGVFDDKTDAAVRLLQSYCGFEETGIIDRKTVVGLYYAKGIAKSIG